MPGNNNNDAHNNNRDRDGQDIEQLQSTVGNMWLGLMVAAGIFLLF